MSVNPDRSTPVPVSNVPIDADETEPVVGPGVRRRPQTLPEFVEQIRETADKLISDKATRGDVKLLSVALKELRYAFKIFSAYRHHRKVTVFGSARTPSTDRSYQQAVEFGRKLAGAEYMVVTGAGGGIMEAGHVGAGPEWSMGLNILLPFEQAANQVMRRSGEKLISLKYFFTRKLMFVKETDAVALFPGGFGTLDEGFEVLTLVQTGKSHLFPIVCIEPPGGTYWRRWHEFIEQELIVKRLISAEDVSLYRITNSVDEAIEEIKNFYRVYHSMRYVKGDLVLRLRRPLSEETLDGIRKDFGSILVKGTFQQTGADPAEENEPQIGHLPRLRFRFDRRSLGRLRLLLNRINAEGAD